MFPMFTLTEIISITGAKLLQGNPEGTVCGVSTDTRTLRSGELFIALVGDKLDGHDFVAQAFAQGAAAAVVSRALAGVEQGNLLLVNDSLLALGQLAASWRIRFDLPVIAVTGSVGKTTTKEMIATILSQSRHVLKTPVNFNNEIGVPLTVLQLGPQHQAGVFEMGMRGKGQIRYLAQIVAPTVGVITNVGLSHLELLQTPLAIAEAKAELLEVLAAHGIAVLNAENEHYDFLKSRAGHTVSFGIGRGDIRAKDIRAEGEIVSFQLWLPEQFDYKSGQVNSAAGAWYTVTLPTPGKYNVMNALAAAATTLCAGVPAAEIVAGLEAFRTVGGRMRILKAPAGFTIIDDTYNASPDSVRAALGVLADMEGTAKIAVLGEMRELGDNSAALHRAIGRDTVALHLSLLVTVGELGKEIAIGAADAQSGAAIVSVTDAQAAAVLLKDRVAADNVILVKASRALGLEAVVEALLQIE
jgi:UDP-N-acetylmuramoyl-tripeptide--D-alanyl-D-alanine ligase